MFHNTTPDQDRICWSETGLVLRPMVSDHITAPSSPQTHSWWVVGCCPSPRTPPRCRSSISARPNESVPAVQDRMPFRALTPLPGYRYGQKPGVASLREASCSYCGSSDRLFSLSFRPVLLRVYFGPIGTLLGTESQVQPTQKEVTPLPLRKS